VPIFEYKCRSCEHEFEALVLRGAEPACPQCSARDLERLLSLPAVKSDGTKARALNAAKQRDSKLGAERVAAQREYERNHD
jgi:putative FmdB family regulatory protein